VPGRVARLGRHRRRAVGCGPRRARRRRPPSRRRRPGRRAHRHRAATRAPEQRAARIGPARTRGRAGARGRPPGHPAVAEWPLRGRCRAVARRAWLTGIAGRSGKFLRKVSTGVDPVRSPDERPAPGRSPPHWRPR
jgi:hypothetical protein